MVETLEETGDGSIAGTRGSLSPPAPYCMLLQLSALTHRTLEKGLLLQAVAFGQQ